MIIAQSHIDKTHQHDRILWHFTFHLFSFFYKYSFFDDPVTKTTRQSMVAAAAIPSITKLRKSIYNNLFTSKRIPYIFKRIPFLTEDLTLSFSDAKLLSGTFTYKYETQIIKKAGFFLIYVKKRPAFHSLRQVCQSRKRTMSL